MPPPNPTHRFFVDSALWHSSLGNLDLTLKALQRVAQINGKQKEGAKLSVEVRPPPKTLCDTPPGLLHLPPPILESRSSGASQEEGGGRGPQGKLSAEPHLSKQLLQMSLQKGQAQPSMLQMLRSPALRQLFFCIVPLW